VSFIWARGTSGPVNNVELTVFPASDAKEETKDIRLFVLVKLY
jgi:hypothetical protein